LFQFYYVDTSTMQIDLRRKFQSYIGRDLLIHIFIEYMKTNTSSCKKFFYSIRSSIWLSLTGLGDLYLGGRRRVVGGFVRPLVVGKAVDRTDADEQLASERSTLDAADRQRRPQQLVLRQVLQSPKSTPSTTVTASLLLAWCVQLKSKRRANRRQWSPGMGSLRTGLRLNDTSRTNFGGLGLEDAWPWTHP